MTQVRKASLSRQTKETKIDLNLNLDGLGIAKNQTGEAFFDHMLDQLAKHSGMDMSLHCVGDLDVDCHHTVEDSGIVLGQAIREALGDKLGIRRYGFASVPMDEALTQVSIDLSGRPFLHFQAEIPAAQLGTFETETVQEFMRALAQNAQMTLHINVLYGDNSHHMIEGIFKALAVALAEAMALDPKREGVLPSTKGRL